MTAAYELHHGDMLEVMATLEKRSVAMVFADIPYCVAGRVNTDCAWDIPVDLRSMHLQISALSHEKTVAVFTANIRLVGPLIDAAEISFRYDLVWQKSRLTGHLNAKKMPMRAHENILVFYNNLPTYNPQMRPNTSNRTGAFVRSATKDGVYSQKSNGQVHFLGAPLLPTSVLSVAAPHAERGLHATQKPVALLEWLIATYTNPGDLVLDPCFGSNSTGVACARLGRRYIGIEKDPGYFQIGKERLEAEHRRLAEGPAQGALAL